MIDKQANTRNGRFYEFNHVDFFFCAKVMRIGMSHMKMKYLSIPRFTTKYEFSVLGSGHEKHFRFAVLAHFVRNNQLNVVQPNLFRLCVSRRVRA